MVHNNNILKMFIENKILILGMIVCGSLALGVATFSEGNLIPGFVSMIIIGVCITIVIKMPVDIDAQRLTK